ncbi:MAG: BrnT family toxin [Bacteroidales bacterium]|jgi:uncharacterized DUF497 family protein|nr:BrnT family toxin [Bacteroidales bacterium]
MKFAWDEQKRKKTLNERGLDFADARKVFIGPVFTFEDERFDYGEKRLVTLGLLDDQVVVIVHTETAKEIRVISMRKGTPNEQKIYFNSI